MGCETGSAPLPTLGGDAAVADASGDWDDVDAAVTHAVGEVDLAVVERLATTPDRAEYRLLSVRDEPGVLTIERRPDRPNLLLEARVGRWGNPGVERGLIEALRKRLAQLRGVETAPLK